MTPIRSAAVEALLATTPPPVGAGPAESVPTSGPQPAAAPRQLLPTFALDNPVRQTARAQVRQIQQYLQHIVTAIQTAETAVPPILAIAAENELLARELVREDIDIALVRDFLRSAQALVDSVAIPTS